MKLASGRPIGQILTAQTRDVLRPKVSVEGVFLSRSDIAGALSEHHVVAKAEIKQLSHLHGPQPPDAAVRIRHADWLEIPDARPKGTDERRRRTSAVRSGPL